MPGGFPPTHHQHTHTHTTHTHTHTLDPLSAAFAPSVRRARILAVEGQSCIKLEGECCSCGDTGCDGPVFTKFSASSSSTDSCCSSSLSSVSSRLDDDGDGLATTWTGLQRTPALPGWTGCAGSGPPDTRFPPPCPSGSGLPSPSGSGHGYALCMSHNH